jgi:type II secretory ATPase GspE/PulE/Tfp pilus assembly ATPase PilB-like protein
MEPMVSMAVADVGNYVNPWKLLAALVILVPWAKLLTWIDKDTVAARLPRSWINLGNIGGLLLVYFLLPVFGAFWLVILALLMMPIVELGVYILLRYQSVGLTDLEAEIKRAISKIGKKKGGDEKVAAGFVQISTKASKPVSVPEEGTPERHTFDSLQHLLSTSLRKRADRIDVVLGEATALSFWVDGIRYDGGSLDRALGGSMIQYLKMIGGLDLNERRKPQSGMIKTQLDNARHEFTVRTAGSKTGEALSLIADIRKRHDWKLPALGFDQSQIDLSQSVVKEPSGVVLIAAPPGQGLRSTTYAVLRAHDAFLTHILTVERAPDGEVEGVTQVVLPHAASGQEEAEKVRWVASQEPDVIAVPVLTDTASAQTMAKFGAETRAYIGLRAGSAFDGPVAEAGW